MKTIPVRSNETTSHYILIFVFACFLQSQEKGIVSFLRGPRTTTTTTLGAMDRNRIFQAAPSASEVIKDVNMKKKEKTRENHQTVI